MQEYSRSEVFAKAQFAALLGARQVKVTGLWAWAWFEGKPTEEVRQQLKAEHFIWAKHKKAWAFRGKPSGNRKSMPWEAIAERYGEEEVNA